MSDNRIGYRVIMFSKAKYGLCTRVSNQNEMLLVEICV